MWPSGCDRVELLPWDFLMAVRHAQRILAWFENRREKDIPPEWMWPFPDEIDRWFDDVDRKDKPERESPDSGWEDNELAAELVKKLKGRR